MAAHPLRLKATSGTNVLPKNKANNDHKQHAFTLSAHNATQTDAYGTPKDDGRTPEWLTKRQATLIAF